MPRSLKGMGKLWALDLMVSESCQQNSKSNLFYILAHLGAHLGFTFYTIFPLGFPCGYYKALV